MKCTRTRTTHDSTTHGASPRVLATRQDGTEARRAAVLCTGPTEPHIVSSYEVLTSETEP